MITKKIASRNKITHWGEILMYSFAMLLLLCVCVYHYYALIEKVIEHHNISDLKNSQDAIKAITGLAIELFCTIGIVAFFYI
jgi:uncharacterized membrane protein